jgi:hypothetical protein
MMMKNLLLAMMFPVLPSAGRVTTGPVRELVHVTPIATARMESLLSGRVVGDDGTPLDHAIVVLRFAGSADAINMARTNQDGRFAVASPPPGGVYVLRNLCLGYRPITLPLQWHHDMWAVPERIVMHAFAFGTEALVLGHVLHVFMG